ncbi:MAG: OsmC family protein [Gemmatimonadota bacterium]
MPDIRTVNLTWQGGQRFTGGAPGGPTLTIDADNKEAPGPMLTLMLAAAACSGADIVNMLPKMQVELNHFDVTVSGERREETPKRFLNLHFEFDLAGHGLDEVKARRAISLAIEKYCSVIESLNPDIPVTYGLTISEA